MVLEWCWSALECFGIVLEGVMGCWSSLECVGVCWNGVGVDWRVLEWLGNGVGVVLEWFEMFWNVVGGC